VETTHRGPGKIVGDGKWLRWLAGEFLRDVLRKLGARGQANDRITAIKEFSGLGNNPDVSVFLELRGAQAAGPTVRIQESLMSGVGDVGNKSEKFRAASVHLAQEATKDPPCGKMMRERQK
jgi:hypothetical protein